MFPKFVSHSLFHISIAKYSILNHSCAIVYMILCLLTQGEEEKKSESCKIPNVVSQVRIVL